MARDERWRQVGTSLAILGGLTVIFVAVAFGSHLPGLAGEFFARVLGVVTTPFILETTLCIVGLVVVLTLNQWRQMREGDELVYLEQVTGSPTDMPDQARWAVYADKPLEGGNIATADLLEGALAIGDYAEAITLLEAMSADERARPEVIRMRIPLAEATGKPALARELRSKLDSQS